MEYGHVEDELFEQLGFPMDRDVDGTTVCLHRVYFVTMYYYCIKAQMRVHRMKILLSLHYELDNCDICYNVMLVDDSILKLYEVKV